MVLGWMIMRRVPSIQHATDATWSKWVALITQQAQIGNPNCPGILEVITDWPEGKDFGILPEEEVICAEKAQLYNKLPANEKPYALFTDGSCCILGNPGRWKAAVRSPTQVAEVAEGEGESSQFAEVKAIQLALDIVEREKQPMLYLYTDSWMVANALWGWLQQWKQSNWQHRGKPIWAAPLWQDIAAWLENLIVKVRHVDAHVPKSRATKGHQNNQQVDQAAKIEVALVDLAT
ncbi:ribonuclease H-like [Grus japonensis]|uniref:Ribonuclease H-like n=1 Tax=Grus japonensis TaxID=30415 RepID=A0ABC9Y672_GRUJA